MELRKAKLAELLKIEEKRGEAKIIEEQMARPDFWHDHQKASTISQQLSAINSIVKRYDKAKTDEEISELEKEALFSGAHDARDTILSIHAGAGGTEAQDWAEMLERMFSRYAEKKGWTCEILDQTRGEEAGIKSATLEIVGYNAYGHLKSEAGVHRLVRISPYDADKARHTSFALVEVIPDLGEQTAVAIDDKDLRVDVYRSSGKGGQSVNTTDSAVRLTHIPTNIVVTVQNERSQLQNKEKALKILKSKLYQLQLAEQAEEKAQLKGEHKSAEWGNQIRSYVLQPYQQVKDHRTDFTSTDPSGVLSGELDGFIEAYLLSKSEARNPKHETNSNL
jgi:peptide chain release factor 2